MHWHVSSWLMLMLMLLSTYTDILVILTCPNGSHQITQSTKSPQHVRLLSCRNQLHLASIAQSLGQNQSQDQNMHDSHEGWKWCIDIIVKWNSGQLTGRAIRHFFQFLLLKSRRVHFRFPHQHPHRVGSDRIPQQPKDRSDPITSSLRSEQDFWCKNNPCAVWMSADVKNIQMCRPVSEVV